MKINHIAVVVPELEGALGFWRDALGLVEERREENAAEAVNISFLPLGECEIELLEPTDSQSGIAKYLANKGAGMHHICIEVEDMMSVIERLRAYAVDFIGEAPRYRHDGIAYCFVHPRSAGGVLVELYELPKE